MQIKDVLTKLNQNVPAVAALSFASGIAVGYLITKKTVTPVIVVPKEEPEYKQLTIFEPVISYSNDSEFEPMIDTEATIVADIYEESEVVEEPVLIVSTVFKEDDDWDYEDELSRRTSTIPYVIHQDEFVQNETDFQQETLTYYVGDDIMADSSDTPVYGYHDLMGDLLFGHGTRDKNVVYIRNEKIKMEWEVLRHEGSFEIEVLGYQYEKSELKHSSVLKFRSE